MTLSTLFEEYLKDYLPERKPSSRHTWLSHARILVAELGDREIHTITERDLRFWIDQTRGRLRPATINHRLSFLRLAFAWALHAELLVANPAARTKAPTGPNARYRYLSADEEVRLLGVMPARAFALVRFAILTGLRRLEIFHLCPEHIDWQREQLLVADSKTGRQRIIPLHPEAMIALLYWKSRGGAWIFEPGLNQAKRWVAAAQWVDRWFRPSLLAAGIEGFRFHDLRHTFASRLVEQGVPLFTVQQLLGHTDPKMTMRYAHLSADHLKQAVYRLN